MDMNVVQMKFFFIVVFEDYYKDFLKSMPDLSNFLGW